MPKYLFKGSFPGETLAAYRRSGFAARDAYNRAFAAPVGGTIECVYFAWGEADLIVIQDLPDDEAATAISLAANSSGAVRVTTTRLFTLEEMDAINRRTPQYQPPGTA